jgi:AmmeMemoRadiSam system protein A
MIGQAERRELLRIARASIAAEVNRIPLVVQSTGEAPARRAGAFVTLHRNGALRGCIGHIEPDQPLAEVVASCAAAACRSDPRFPAVTEAELPDVEIELSVLGPLEVVTALDQIEIGRHGLVVEMQGRRGLLLPQVAAEYGWDRQTFVEQTCHKAGLPKQGWPRGATIWKFDAEVFCETGSH